MQTVLPFFPEDTKMINATLGFREINGIVYYLQYGKPIYCHEKHDHNSYRFSLANLIQNKACSIKELSAALGVRRKNIERYAKSLREQGAGYFFGHTDGRGQCYKMTPDKIVHIQSDLDKGVSIYRTALNHDISESAINYHIKNGNLKKKRC
jgi:biotin operon repressor